MADSERATVLVVDDDPAVVDLFEQFLADYDVRTAGDAAAALSAADGADVVLLDRGLPDRSGDEVLTELRDRGSTAAVVMVTGAAPEGDPLEAGYDDYILKPPDPGSVQAAVADALE
jgi:DNA-binding response OmpR family regulator